MALDDVLLKYGESPLGNRVGKARSADEAAVRGLDIAQQDQPFIQATRGRDERPESRLPNGGLNRSIVVETGGAATWQ